MKVNTDTYCKCVTELFDSCPPDRPGWAREGRRGKHSFGQRVFEFPLWTLYWVTVQVYNKDREKQRKGKERQTCCSRSQSAPSPVRTQLSKQAMSAPSSAAPGKWHCPSEQVPGVPFNRSLEWKGQGNILSSKLNLEKFTPAVILWNVRVWKMSACGPRTDWRGRVGEGRESGLGAGGQWGWREMAGFPRRARSRIHKNVVTDWKKKTRREWKEGWCPVLLSSRNRSQGQDWSTSRSFEKHGECGWEREDAMCGGGSPRRAAL